MNHPTKEQLRPLLKERRKNIAGEERKAAEAEIVRLIADSPAFQTADTVLLYAPYGSELNLLPLARIARKENKKIAFPKCNTEEHTIRFFYLELDARLKEGAYGIPEPDESAPECIPDKNTLCIVPALSFDLCGNRLGSGLGYYDRFLSHFEGMTMGATFSQLLLQHVPCDKHDIPVSLLVTEKGIRPCVTEENKADGNGIASSEAQGTDSNPAQDPKGKALSRGNHILEWIKNWWAEGTEDEKSNRLLKPLHTPPLLVLSVFLLLLLSRALEPRLLDKNSEYVGVILLQLLIFILPAIVYASLRGEKFKKRMRLSILRPEHLWMMLCLLMLMISGSLLLSILTGGISSLSGNFTLYSAFVAHVGDSPKQIIFALLAYTLLPALCEELIFRSFLCAEYEKYSVAISVTVSAVLFSMLHGSFSMFPTYLYLGVLLALSMYVARSMLAPILLHFLYNLFCLFGQPYLSAFYLHAGSNEIFIFCLGVIFLLFAAFAAGEARKIYHLYAKANLDSSYTVPITLKEYPHRLFHALASPAFLLCVVYFFIVASIS